MSKLILTILLIEVMAGLIWICVWALSGIWRKTVQIEAFTDNTDGSLGKFLQQSIDMTIRSAQQIHRKADLSAISPASTFEIPFLKPESSTLKKLQDLDIRVKDVSLNTFLKAMELFRQPTYVVRANVLSDKQNYTAAVEMTGGGDEPAGILVSIPKTSDAEADKLKLANEVGYRLLYELVERFKGEETIAAAENWRSLELYTEGLKALQDYRNAERYGDSIAGKLPQNYLDAAITKFENAHLIDPNFDYGTYYLAVSYFERRGKEDDAIKLFEGLVNKTPAPPLKLEARFYLGYSYFRKYTPDDQQHAIDQDKLLIADLQHLVEIESGGAKQARLTGLLAESYCQLATTHAHMISPDPPRDHYSDAQLIVLRKQKDDHVNGYNSSMVEVYKIVANSRKLSPEMLNDIDWRRENARGIFESRLAFFERDTHGRFIRDDYDRRKIQALEHYQKALLKAPRNFNVLENIGRTLRDVQYGGHNLEKAETYYLDALQLKPNDDFGHAEMGRLYQEWERKAITEHNSAKAEKYRQMSIDYFGKAMRLGDTDSRDVLVSLAKKGDSAAIRALKRAGIDFK